MKPTWTSECGTVQLYLGDCLEVLPALAPGSVDCVCCDPPYSSGGLHRAARARSISEKYVASGAAIEYAEFSGDARDQRAWTAWCSWWMRACQKATREHGYLLSFIDWRQVPAITDAIQWADWTWCGIIPWNKGLGSRAGNTSMFRHQCEYVVWATKGGTAGYCDRSGPWPGFFDVSAVPPAQRLHQSEKPVELLESVLACCERGETVVDAFMGSASCGVAAVRRGLRFIGCELDASNFNASVERIQDELRRVEFLEPRKPRQKQVEMFSGAD